MTHGDKPQALKTASRATVFAIATLLAFGGSTVWPFSATAQVSVDVVIGTPPPPARVEVVPGPRPGYLWAPGYWSWDGDRDLHVWHRGYWEAERADQHFVPAEWINTPAEWRFVPARWEHADHWHCPPGLAMSDS